MVFSPGHETRWPTSAAVSLVCAQGNGDERTQDIQQLAAEGFRVRFRPVAAVARPSGGSLLAAGVVSL